MTEVIKKDLAKVINDFSIKSKEDISNQAFNDDSYLEALFIYNKNYNNDAIKTTIFKNVKYLSEIKQPKQYKWLMKVNDLMALNCPTTAPSTQKTYSNKMADALLKNAETSGADVLKLINYLKKRLDARTVSTLAQQNKNINDDGFIESIFNTFNWGNYRNMFIDGLVRNDNLMPKVLLNFKGKISNNLYTRLETYVFNQLNLRSDEAINNAIYVINTEGLKLYTEDLEMLSERTLCKLVPKIKGNILDSYDEDGSTEIYPILLDLLGRDFFSNIGDRVVALYVDEYLALKNK